ncbi:MAG TPA: Flp family type IVb pilin [Beijerinckiaceae bacterium]
MLRRFLRDTRGATSIEYALIGGAIFVVIVGAITTIGPKLNAKYSGVLPGLD